MMRFPARPAVLLAATLVLAACGAMDSNVARFEEPVTAVQTDATADVPAIVLARALAEAGLSADQILEYGPAVRNALARSGGAQISEGATVLALVSVLDGRLYVVSGETGTVVLPLSGA
jgi:hypothetical protein